MIATCEPAAAGATAVRVNFRSTLSPHRALLATSPPALDGSSEPRQTNLQQAAVQPVCQTDIGMGRKRCYLLDCREHVTVVRPSRTQFRNTIEGRYNSSRRRNNAPDKLNSLSQPCVPDSRNSPHSLRRDGILG